MTKYLIDTKYSKSTETQVSKLAIIANVTPKFRTWSSGLSSMRFAQHVICKTDLDVDVRTQLSRKCRASAYNEMFLLLQLCKVHLAVKMVELLRQKCGVPVIYPNVEMDRTLSSQQNADDRCGAVVNIDNDKTRLLFCFVNENVIIYYWYLFLFFFQIGSSRTGKSANN